MVSAIKLRATVLSCFPAMNVTLKLPDDLCREARHRAVDESKSLSAWIASLVAREVKRPAKAVPLLNALGDESLAEGEFELPDRRVDSGRLVEFP